MLTSEDLRLFVQHVEYTEDRQGSPYSAVTLLSNEILVCIFTQ